MMTSHRGEGTGSFLHLDHNLPLSWQLTHFFPIVDWLHTLLICPINPSLSRGRGGPSVSEGGGPGILSARGVQPTVVQPR